MAEDIELRVKLKTDGPVTDRAHVVKSVAEAIWRQADNIAITSPDEEASVIAFTVTDTQPGGWQEGRTV